MPLMGKMSARPPCGALGFRGEDGQGQALNYRFLEKEGFPLDEVTFRELKTLASQLGISFPSRLTGKQ